MEGGQFLDFVGAGHNCYEGGHRAHGPPTRENPVKSCEFQITFTGSLKPFIATLCI